MMKRAVGLLLVLMLALSGCTTEKKISRDEMLEAAPLALARLAEDVGPQGDLARVDVEGWINVEVETQFGPIKSQLTAKSTIDVGPGASISMTGKLSAVQYRAYCDAEHVIVITDGLDNYGEEDVDVEMRNLIGVCTGKDAEPLLTAVAEFDLVDPSILLGELDPMELDFIDVEPVKNQRFLATYSNDGLVGSTTLTIDIDKGIVQSVTADNEDSHLVMTMTYGERGDITRHVASERAPTEVYGPATTNDDGWTWRGTFREGAPIDEMELHIFEDGAKVGCGSAPDPIATFDLGASPIQEDAGFQFQFFEDGDGRLGPGDEIRVRHPGSLGDDWTYEAEFYDAWAEQYAMFGCDTPGLAWTFSAIGLLGLAVLARRRD